MLEVFDTSFATKLHWLFKPLPALTPSYKNSFNLVENVKCFVLSSGEEYFGNIFGYRKRFFYVPFT